MDDISSVHFSFDAHAPTTTNIRVLILSDTHFRDDSSDEDGPNQEYPSADVIHPSADIVLHCGDITENGELNGYEKAIRLLGSIDAELKLVLAGNHDITLDERFYTSQGGNIEACEKARNLWDQAPSNIHLLKEGVHTFRLANGLSFKIYASPYTPEFGISALRYPTGHDRFNPNEATRSWAKNIGTNDSRIPEDVDIVVTHGPPKYILDDCGENQSGGCEFLRQAVFRAKSRLHCFGHIHRGWGAQRMVWKGQQGRALEAGKNQKREMDSNDDLEDDFDLLSPEFVGKNACKRKGYARLSPGSAEALLTGDQTLFVNAAVMDDKYEPSNFPWLIELAIEKKIKTSQNSKMLKISN